MPYGQFLYAYNYHSTGGYYVGSQANPVPCDQIGPDATGVVDNLGQSNAKVKALGVKIATYNAMKRAFQLFIAVALALAVAPKGATAQDVVIYTHPQRPSNPSAVHALKAILIGYDENRGNSKVSPYVVLRVLDDNALIRVFISPDTKIDGVPFFCPFTPGATKGFGVCPRLPSAFALKLPVIVELAVWQDSVIYEKGPVLGTDTINVVGLPTQQP